MKTYQPILSFERSQELERRILGGSAELSYAAMERSGTGLAECFLREFAYILPKRPKILALVGNGHNGGDALIALREIAREFPDAEISIVCKDSPDSFKPNTRTAFEKLAATAKSPAILPHDKFGEIAGGKFDLLIDGLLGMGFNPPIKEYLAAEIETANAVNATLKISVDVPSGAADTEQSPIFCADATYATGICKDALFKPFNRKFAGRIRYVDIGFFDAPAANGFAKTNRFITSPNALDFLKTPRRSISDKRTFGHLFVIAGSRRYSGAAMLAVKSALRGGAGLVSAFVPESFAAAFAAAEPSAMWIGCPEDESGAIALESFGLIRAKLSSATALLCGSGLSDSPETLALLCEVLKTAPDLPAVLDADAIRKQTAEALPARNAPALLTPHEGEILRIARDASDESLLQACNKYNCCIALKSSATRISDGEKIVYQTRGCPALARAGSGDILAGLAGSLAANKSHGFENAAFEAGICASTWLGLAAENAAAKLGETALATSDIIKFLPSALRRNGGA